MCLQFRLVVASDFAKKMTWPELVPALKAAIQNSDLVINTGTSELKTLNVMMGLQTIIKPYQVTLLPYCKAFTYQLSIFENFSLRFYMPY